MISLTHHHRYLSTVPRWSVVPVSRFQNVAEHSYFVSLYVVEMLKLPCFDHWAYDRKYAAIRYSLVHDIAEARMGDIPGPVKRMVKDAARFEETELRVTRDMGVVDKYGNDPYHDDDIKRLVKVADLVDEYLHLTMEMVGGNKHVTKLHEQVNFRLWQAIEAAPLAGNVDDVRQWVDRLAEDIEGGVETLQNNDDVAASNFGCSDAARCGHFTCPVCDGVPF